MYEKIWRRRKFLNRYLYKIYKKIFLFQFLVDIFSEYDTMVKTEDIQREVAFIRIYVVMTVSTPIVVIFIFNGG